MNITATLIIQMIAFITFIILINKMLYKPLSAIMVARQKRIEEGLIAAERGQLEQKESKEKIQQILDQSKSKASEIITNAQKQADLIVVDAKETAISEAEKIKKAAHNDAEQEIVRAKSELQSKISGLVMLGVKKILQKEVDQKTHQQFLVALSKNL